jgi:hypothetical protein
MDFHDLLDPTDGDPVSTYPDYAFKFQDDKPIPINDCIQHTHKIIKPIKNSVRTPQLIYTATRNSCLFQSFIYLFFGWGGWGGMVGGGPCTRH